MPAKSTLDLAARTLYMDIRPRGNKVERHAAAQHSKFKNAGKSNVRIRDTENIAARRDKVQEALMVEARAKAKRKAKGEDKSKSTTGPSPCCGSLDGYEYCDIQSLTPTHVVYKQGAELLGRSYEFDAGYDDITLGPVMHVHSEMIFGDEVDEDDKDEYEEKA